jgi:hypothetical protein
MTAPLVEQRGTRALAGAEKVEIWKKLAQTDSKLIRVLLNQ